MANISGEFQEMVIERSKNRVEISPTGFGWIWSIEYGDSKIATSIQKKLQKLPQEKLYQMWEKANQTIPQIRDTWDFHNAGRELVQQYLQKMTFKIYGRNFDDGAIIVGSQEVYNPEYDGKAYPCIEVMKNTGEIMDSRLIAKDSDYWADAFEFASPGGTANFIVHELGGRKEIEKMLNEIIKES